MREKLAFTKQEKICFIITAVIGIVIYYQMPSNWLTNPDTVWNAIYFRNGHGGEKANGRLLQILMDKLRMNMITPVLTTLVCVLMLAVIAVLIMRIFECKSIFSGTLIGLLLLFMPSTSSSLTYYYCSDSFMLAFLCAVLGTYIIKEHADWRGSLVGVSLLFVSEYLYQAYICVVFALAVMLLIFDMLSERKVKDALLQFGRYVIICVAALGLYVISFKILQILLHIEVRADRGMDFSDLFNLSVLPGLIRNTYVNWFEYYFGNGFLNNEFGDRNLINLMVVILGLVSIFILWVKGEKKRFRSGILLLGVLFLPLASTAITIMAPKVEMSIIMIPALVCTYLLTLVAGIRIAEHGEQIKWVGYIDLAVVCFFAWNSVVFTELCINSMQLQLNKTQTVADMMLDEITDQYGYSKDSKLLVAGSMEDGNFPKLYGWPTDVIQWTSASYGFMWDTYTGNEECWINFFKQYRGVAFESCGQDIYKELLLDEEYQEMPLFPQEGSVRKFDDIIVVKMSDVELE